MNWRGSWPACGRRGRRSLQLGFLPGRVAELVRGQQVDYLIGVAKNDRLKAQLAPAMVQAQAQCQASGQPARVFADFGYRTRELDRW